MIFNFSNMKNKYKYKYQASIIVVQPCAFLLNEVTLSHCTPSPQYFYYYYYYYYYCYFSCFFFFFNYLFYVNKLKKLTLATTKEVIPGRGLILVAI